MHSFRLRKPSGASPTGLEEPQTCRPILNLKPLMRGPIAEVRGTSCGALDLELEAENEVAHESHSARPPTGGKPVSMGSDPAAAQSLTGAGLCVSFH